MLCALISVETETELLDATEPLKFRRVDQANHEPALGIVLAQGNNVVDGIAVDSLGQFFGPAIGLGSQSITRKTTPMWRKDSGKKGAVTKSQFFLLRNFGIKPNFRIW